MDTTGRAFVDHWIWAAEKGLMNKNTAGGIKAACQHVLGVLDDWEAVDVRTLDVDDVLRRFQTLKGREFLPKSLAEYQRRFRTALTSFLAYVENPGSWRYATMERAPRSKESANTGERRSERRPNDDASAEPVATVHELRATGLVDYPFPLREGQMVRLALPRDLTRAEVRRITAYMQTLTVDFDAE